MKPNRHPFLRPNPITRPVPYPLLCKACGRIVGTAERKADVVTVNVQGCDGSHQPYWEVVLKR